MKKELIISLLLCLCNAVSAQKTVMLDNYYNHEINKAGKVWHYTWEDTSEGGFSQLGDMFRNAGGVLKTLTEKPNAANLSGSSVYIIVDPDTEKETKTPNFMDETAATEIMKWVKAGGRLVLFTNDKGNCDLDKINILSEKAGMHFNDNSISNERPFTRTQRYFNDCAFTKFARHPMFKGVNKILLKGVCTIRCVKPAKGIVKSDDGGVVIAQSKIGKGYVIAITDPWLYNEYIGHQLLPADFNNEKAAVNMVEYLLK